MTGEEEATLSHTAHCTKVMRTDDWFHISIAADGAMSTTFTLGRRAADELLTALTQHMMDWHFEKHPGDMFDTEGI